MGSGRGKTQRVRADTAQARKLDVRIDTRRLANFVSQNRLKGVYLGDYYDAGLLYDLVMGTDQSVQEVKDAKTKIAREFFYDLVRLKAIQLPPGVVADEFSFIVDTRPEEGPLLPERGATEDTLVIQRGAKKTDVEFNTGEIQGGIESSLDSVLRFPPTIGSAKVTSLACAIADAATRVLS